MTKFDGIWTVRVGDEWGEDEAADTVTITGAVATWNEDQGVVSQEGDRLILTFQAEEGRAGSRLLVRPLEGDDDTLSGTLYASADLPEQHVMEAAVADEDRPFIDVQAVLLERR